MPVARLARRDDLPSLLGLYAEAAASRVCDDYGSSVDFDDSRVAFS
jgi:hypothetical protein